MSGFCRLKKISVCCLSMKTNRLYLGTEGGNIYLLDINSFELQEYIIYQDVVMQRLATCIWNYSLGTHSCYIYLMCFSYIFVSENLTKSFFPHWQFDIIIYLTLESHRNDTHVGFKQYALKAYSWIFPLEMKLCPPSSTSGKKQ